MASTPNAELSQKAYDLYVSGEYEAHFQIPPHVPDSFAEEYEDHLKTLRPLSTKINNYRDALVSLTNIADESCQTLGVIEGKMFAVFQSECAKTGAVASLGEEFEAWTATRLRQDSIDVDGTNGSNVIDGTVDEQLTYFAQLFKCRQQVVRKLSRCVLARSRVKSEMLPSAEQKFIDQLSLLLSFEARRGAQPLPAKRARKQRNGD